MANDIKATLAPGHSLSGPGLAAAPGDPVDLSFGEAHRMAARGMILPLEGKEAKKLATWVKSQAVETATAAPDTETATASPDTETAAASPDTETAAAADAQAADDQTEEGA
jgi:hypothetical protein